MPYKNFILSQIDIQLAALLAAMFFCVAEMSKANITFSA